MLQVLQAAFPRWPAIEISVTAIDHLHWKLEGTPDPETTHVVAVADDRIIGCHPSLVRMYHNEGPVVVRTDVDVAVAPDWRGRGVNGANTKLAVDTSVATLVLTSTDNESLKRADHYRGHRPIQNSLISQSSDLSLQGDKFDPRVHAIEVFDGRIESFWARASAPYEFITWPTAAWLNWRYCDPRGGNGFVLQAEEGGEIAGFLAARTSWGKGNIAYMLANPDRDDIIQALLLDCLIRFKNAGLDDAACALPKRHPYRSLLTNLGFAQNRRHIPLSARPGRAGDPERSFRDDPRARVHIMYGDLDFV